MAPPRLLSATPVGTTAVLLTFDQSMGGDARLSLLSYSIDGGLRVVGVSAVSGYLDQIKLFTTGHVSSRAYRVFVSAIVTNAGGEAMNTSQAEALFVGLSSSSSVLVRDLVARSGLDGRRIELYWNQPSGVTVQTVVILRRQRSWVFDPTDSDCDIIYQGVPDALLSDPIGGFDKTFVDTGLRSMTYYYYTVLVSTTAGAALSSLESGPESKTYALSTSALDSDKWVERKGMIPRHWFTADAGEGGYTLQKIITITGAWLDLMRSHMKAGAFIGKWADVAYPLLADLNRSIGFEPEGEQYDFDTLRRTLLLMSDILTINGRMAGISAAIWALVEWECDIVEFGVYERRRVFGVLNPDTLTHLGTDVRVGDSEYGYLADPSVAIPWVVDQWINARVTDAFGNWFSVISNTTTELSLDTGSEANESVSTTTGILIGTHDVQLGHIGGILVGQRVSIRNPANDNTDILSVVAVDGPSRTITFWNTTGVFPIGSLVTWRIQAPQLKFVGDTSAVGVDSLTVDLQGGSSGWETNQWVGFYVRDSAGVNRQITASSTTGFTFGVGDTPAAGAFTLARTFDVADPIGTYSLHLGDRPTLYNPLWDRTLRGTRFDPFYYLMGGGYTSSLMGAWGPCDLGIYITTPSATAAVGRVSSKDANSITDAGAAFTVDEFVGYYLNPNQNQGRLLKILSNTATTITVSGDSGRMAVVGQGYFVLTPRNAQRYERLKARIGEFIPDGLRPHLLFL